MVISDLLEVLDEIAPFELQFTEGPGDNCGLVIGRKGAEVRRIMVCLDLTRRAVETAKKEYIDLIITHHPPIWSPLRRINNDMFIDLMESGINVISLHTNYDSARLNDILAQRIGLLRTEGILRCNTPTGVDSFLGRIGILDEELTGEDMILRVKEELGIEAVRIIGNVKERIESVAVCQGSSGGYENEIIELEPDVFITGEVKYNAAVDLSNAGCFVIEAGHYETEKLFVNDLIEELGYRTPELELMPFYDRIVDII
jgi:dinuclear metal center YbgI/SA1388 family protein